MHSLNAALKMRYPLMVNGHYNIMYHCITKEMNHLLTFPPLFLGSHTRSGDISDQYAR